MKLEGVYSVLPTPFTRTGDLDEASLRSVVDLFIGAGVNGVTALGVTGEVARLDDGERARVLDVVVEQVDGRIGVVAGTTADGTRTCIELQPPRAGGRRHRRDGQPAAHAQAELRGGRAALHGAGRRRRHRDRRAGLSADLGLSRWSRRCSRGSRSEIPRARTIKLEDPPTPFKTSRILEQRGDDAELRIFGGLGGVFLLEELMAGATGAMTGFAFPEILVQIVSLFRAGDVDERGRRVLPRRAADALRVPGGHRHGDPQGSAAPARRAREPGDARARRAARRGDAGGARSRDGLGRHAEA